ncbi:hypothetical protein [Psychrobacillus sp. BL-248-WT-3]|uniref:hypothetical protein n=1 Tax=Psychrobacillus sp. BL-248-WT-3 TaxID=2725306 RepID=UPI001469FFE7|nr:hypothetical protein [Psychrobacillus sp. BL-248-WT-3]
MGKSTNIIFVVLLSFVISYILSSAFAHYGLNTSNLITGFIIIGLTLSAVSLFGKLFSEKTVVGE